MSPPAKDDQWLDDVLREDAMYLEDDGFTERVMHRLPPQRNRSRWRPIILLASALLACVVGLVILPGGEYVANALYELIAYRPRQSPLPVIPLALVLLLIGGGVAAAAHD